MDEIKGNKFLVTGGAGFIGSHICEELVKQGKEVIIIDNFVNGKRENLEGWWNPNLCTLVTHSVTDSEIEKYFAAVDVVFHNAASKCTVCMDNPYLDLSVNAWGTFNVFDCARKAGVRKVVHASTGSVNNGKPVSYYGVSKMAGEAYTRAFRDYYTGFKYTVLRYHHVYGTRQDYRDKGGVIPIFIRNVLFDEPIKITGDGKQVRHFTSVKDVVRANFFVANNESTDYKMFNLLSDNSTSIFELAHIIWDEMHCSSSNPPIEFLPRRPGEIDFFSVTSDKLKSLGFDFKYDFRMYLQEVIEWYRKYLNGKKL